jgi:hypothetical protein
MLRNRYNVCPMCVHACTAVLYNVCAMYVCAMYVCVSAIYIIPKVLVVRSSVATGWPVYYCSTVYRMMNDSS